MTKRRLRARERALLDALSGDECRRVLAELVRSVAGASEIVEQAVTDLLGVVSVESVVPSEGSNQQAIASVSMRDAPAGCQRLRSRPVSGVDAVVGDDVEAAVTGDDVSHTNVIGN